MTQILRPFVRSQLLGLTLLLAVAGSASAEQAQDPDPNAWLMRMNDAFSLLTYDGVFSYFDGEDLATLRVVHKVVDGLQRERLVHLNGAPREIIRHGDEVACVVMPGDKLLELEGSIPSGPFARAFARRYDKLGEAYHLEYAGEDRVAGRDSRRFVVRPRDAHRYGYRLWLDAENQLLLRSELIDEQGQRLEIFQFASIIFGDEVADSALEQQGYQGSLVSHLTLATQTPKPVPAADLQWTAGWLPAGFEMAAADVRRTPQALKAVHTLMYSDGLAAFSVFIEEMPPGEGAEMVSRSGATVAVSRGLHNGSQAHLVTLVGEIPTPTAERILNAISRRKQ